jgi:hypothetical protein
VDPMLPGISSVIDEVALLINVTTALELI